MSVNTASRDVLKAIGMRYVRTFPSADDPVPGTELGEVEYEMTRGMWQALREREGTARDKSFRAATRTEGNRRNPSITAVRVRLGVTVRDRLAVRAAPPAAAATGRGCLYRAAPATMAFLGVSLRSAETVQTAGFPLVMPLGFASSVFAPASSMPGWLQAFVKVNPVTVVTDATRGLMIGGPVANPLLESAAWLTPYRHQPGVERAARPRSRLAPERLRHAAANESQTPAY